MNKRICLIGCGNVGSRHLQAIAKLPFEIEVDIVEPNLEAMSLGQKRLDEIEYDNKTHNFTWYSKLEEIKENYDLTVIATTAIGRADLLINLAELGHRKFLIEKMVCQSNSEYEKILSKFEEKNAIGWVNTNPRCFESYKKLKEYFKESGIIHFSVTASNLSALATNTIHYMDLFSYFVDDYNIEMNGEYLLEEKFPNKRGNNLMEFAGTVIGRNKKKSTIILTFLPCENIPTMVDIVGIDKHLMIDESNQKIFDFVNSENIELEFKFEHVSTLTTKIAENILVKNNCDLTTLENSYILHKEIFKIFNSHIKKLTNKDMDLCPIT